MTFYGLMLQPGLLRIIVSGGWRVLCPCMDVHDPGKAHYTTLSEGHPRYVDGLYQFLFCPPVTFLKVSCFGLLSRARFSTITACSLPL